MNAPLTSRLILRLATLSIVVIATSCALLTPHAIVPAREIPRHSAATFYDTVSLRGVSLAPDGETVLFTSDRSGVFNAYTVPIGGGDPTALTTSTTDAIAAATFFPRDRRVVYLRDQGGNELDHVYVREVDGREVDVTPGERLKAMFVGFAGDEQSFFVATNERDPRFFDLYRHAIDGYARTLTFQNEAGYELKDVSSDGRFLVLGLTHDNKSSELLLVDTTRPADPPRALIERAPDVTYGDVAFSPDGGALYYTCDEGSEFQRLFAIKLERGARMLVHESPWDVTNVRITRDGRFRIVSVNVDARTELAIHDLSTDRKVELPDLGGLDVLDLDISKDGRRLACLAGSDTSPANLFVIDLETQAITKLTNTLSPAIDENNLAKCEVVRVPGLDGLPVPSLLYRPLTASPANRVPALLMMHGGPGGQSRVSYNPTLQHLVNHGIAVLAVNNRGSSGYGKTFFHLDDKKHGEADLDDCVAAKNWLAAQEWCDGERVGIMGGSYGGYLVLAALAYRPEVFTLGIDIYGVANWPRTLESIPPWWASMRDRLYTEMGDPTTDRERLTRQSPVFHPDKIRRPLLVMQGANDPRVLQVESDEMVAAVKKNGVPVEYVVFPDEGHGFQKRSNRIAASDTYLAFCRKWLMRDSSAP
jgi:dipeptidyl aminopeptidase/acylaminoacyl peptidase